MHPCISVLQTDALLLGYLAKQIFTKIVDPQLLRNRDRLNPLPYHLAMPPLYSYNERVIFSSL